LAHVTMEPQNCTVHVTADKIEIWGPTQVPTSVKRGAAAWAGTPGKTVILHTSMLGGGFGRRLMTDYVEQAVKIAAQYDAPVQMVWTREEDFTHDVYRTAVHQTYRAGLRPDGLIDGYETISVAADTGIRGGMDPAPYNTVKGHAITQAAQVKTGIPFGYWRSVDEGISTWGRESFIDECAIAAGQDCADYRMKLLGDNARAARLVKAVTEKIGWKTPRGPGIGRGVAVGVGFGSMAAHAVEVEVKGDAIKVRRIVVAGDLGTVVAPGQVNQQFEGGTLMALSAALGEGMTFTDGKADQTNFGAYQMLRHHQAPRVEVILFDSPEATIGGSGEPPVPTLAPALANAIFQATGKRVRSLPIKNEGFTV
jgi:isoquinoline 1-oxidoreductase beta subunit